MSEQPMDRGKRLGSYRVLESLGEGGMGAVYRAEHIELGREVAIKLLRAEHATRRDLVARLRKEARTVNRIRHRNVVDVSDIVRLDDGTTFIVMELLRGDSLGDWSRTGIDLARALRVFVQICDGLAAAHAAGVVHRDLTPHNVFVLAEPERDRVKLLDFGVAKVLTQSDDDLECRSHIGSVFGTPAYMSPEQATGRPVDARSDIYALGAIMYEMFCGQPMFRADNLVEYARLHLTRYPIPPSSTVFGAHIDPRIEAVILRCLEKNPARRFETITQVRDELLAILGELVDPGLLQQRLIARARGSGSAVQRQISASPPERRRVWRSSRLWWFGLGVFIAVTLGICAAIRAAP